MVYATSGNKEFVPSKDQAKSGESKASRKYIVPKYIATSLEKLKTEDSDK